MTFDSLLIHTCYLGIKTTTTNALGEIKESWSYSTTATKCRMSPVSASQKLELPGEYQDVKYLAFFKPDVNISAGDRIKFNGNEYLIKSASLDSTSHHITASIMEL